MPSGLEQPLSNMSFAQMVASVSRLHKATAKNSARRALAKLMENEKKAESRAVAAMQARREAAEKARKIANYHRAQAAKAASAEKALAKAVANPTPANVRSANAAATFVRRGRFKVYN
jgi:hypothetical protein